jgi:RNA polymerase sigma factor (sigma-70 family)
MSSDSPNEEPAPGGVRRFATTHWSIVLAAGRRPSPFSHQALATLCETYWYPLYAHVRRRGYRAEQAQDLIQEFFARLLAENYLRVADPQRGRFRSFLLAALNHFLAKERRRARAQKRGGGRIMLSWDFLTAEGRYGAEPAHELTADKIYERRWALTLIDRALAQLREEAARSGRSEQFEQMKPYLGGDEGAVPYRELATALGMTEGAVKVAVHRMRRRCRNLLRKEIAQTVAGPQEVEEELRDLFNVVSR